MSKSTPSEPDPEAKPIFEVFNKFKSLRHFEQSVGFLVFFYVSICVICGFFYLDYSRAAAERFLFPGHSERFTSKGANKDKGVEFFGEKGGESDLFSSKSKGHLECQRHIIFFLLYILSFFQVW